MAEETRKERETRLKSVPWIHYDPKGDLDYASEIKPPFANAIPFYSRYEGVYPGKMGATEFSKKMFPTLKKPGIFSKKKINGTLYWVYAGEKLSMKIEEPINVNCVPNNSKQYVNLVDFKTSIVLFIKSWDCSKLAKYIYDNKLYGKDSSLFDLADYVNKSFKKVLENGFRQGILQFSNVYGKTVYVVPSFHGLNNRNDKGSESYKQHVREKLYIVEEMNKALKAIGAQNGSDDVINIGDHAG